MFWALQLVVAAPAPLGSLKPSVAGPSTAPAGPSATALAGLDAERGLVQRCSSAFDGCSRDFDCARSQLELAAGWTNSLLRTGSVPEQLSRRMLAHVATKSETGAELVLCMLDLSEDDVMAFAEDESVAAALAVASEGPTGGIVRRRRIFFSLGALIGGAIAAATKVGSAVVVAGAAAKAAVSGMVGFVATAGGGMTAASITTWTGVAMKGLAPALTAGFSTVAAVDRIITNEFGDAGTRGDNFLMIHNAGPGGICLDASERNNDGGKVHMWECDRGNHNQQWIFDVEKGRIQNAHGKCLDASERSKDGGKVHMWSCIDNEPNQQWQYDPPTGQIKNLHGICLDASDRSSKGGKVHMWECNTANDNQKWRIGTPVSRARSRRAPASEVPCWVDHELDQCDQRLAL